MKFIIKLIIWNLGQLDQEKQPGVVCYLTINILKFKYPNSGQTGMCGGVRGVSAGGIVSSAYCLLFKLYTLKLTKKQVGKHVITYDVH